MSVYTIERFSKRGWLSGGEKISPEHSPSSTGGRRPLPLPLFTASVIGTVLLLCFCTWGLVRLRELTGEQRPYTILYLIPVALGAALMGVRGGLGAAVLALVFARVYLFNDQRHGLDLLRTFPNASESVEFLALICGTLTVSIVTGRLRSALGQVRASQEHVAQANEQLERSNRKLVEANAQLEDANTLLRESEEQRGAFHRDVLLAVTDGKLRLVEPEEMPPPDLAAGAPVVTLPQEEPADAARLRRTLEKIAADIGMDTAKTFDLCTGTTEAATNAIKHGGGGKARVWVFPDAIAVETADRGTGIAPTQIARATLQQGYSTKISLGIGFHLMLQVSDVLALSTTPKGTSILLRVTCAPHPDEQETLLSRYVGL